MERSASNCARMAAYLEKHPLVRVGQGGRRQKVCLHKLLTSSDRKGGEGLSWQPGVQFCGAAVKEVGCVRWFTGCALHRGILRTCLAVFK
jgi:hypothetical protein